MAGVSANAPGRWTRDSLRNGLLAQVILATRRSRHRGTTPEAGLVTMGILTVPAAHRPQGPWWQSDLIGPNAPIGQPPGIAPEFPDQHASGGEIQVGAVPMSEPTATQRCACFGPCLRLRKNVCGHIPFRGLPSPRRGCSAFCFALLRPRPNYIREHPFLRLPLRQPSRPAPTRICRVAAAAITALSQGRDTRPFDQLRLRSLGRAQGHATAHQQIRKRPRIVPWAPIALTRNQMPLALVMSRQVDAPML
jgi:hypothetical protein